MTQTPTKSSHSYNTGCRCDDCRARQTIHMQNYRRRKAEKEWGLVHASDLIDPTPTQYLIWDANRVRGLSYVVIAETCGVEKQTVSAIANGKVKHITRQTADKLGVLEREVPAVYLEQSVVDAMPHVWKYQGLAAQGWRKVDLQKILRESGRGKGRWLDHLGEKPQMYHGNRLKLDWLVELIGDRKGPSASTAARMHCRGIFPLIHYTDDGELIKESLTKEQRDQLKRVR